MSTESRTRRVGVAMLGVLMLSLAARADSLIYRWTDAEGQLHFAQSLDQVPAAKRAAALARAEERRSDPEDRLQIYASPASPAPVLGGSGRNAALAGDLRIPFKPYGTLMMVNAKLNDRIDTPFLIDTGASGLSLPAKVVERLGIRVDANTPRVVVQTANGAVQVPLVRIDSVELGGARVEGLTATVNPSMSIGLLGGSFFNNFLYSIDAAANVISLKPNAGIRGGLREAEWREQFRSLRGPLEKLESYLATQQPSRASRRAELTAHRDRLRAELSELEREATSARVPASWRE